MEVTIEQTIAEFNQRVNNLYFSIAQWCEEAGLKTSIEDKINTEERSGSYATKKLNIFKDDKKIAVLNPIGMWIIGADGRVDLETDSGKEILVYWREGGYGLKSEISIADKVIESTTRQLFSDTQEGWHWMDDRILGKAPLLDKEVFLKVLDWNL
jgi:hypothetical protein